MDLALIARVSSVVIALAASLANTTAVDEFTEAERLFALEIKPLLSDKCFACHGSDPEKIKGGLRLLSRQDMLQGGESSRTVLVPGKAAESDLFHAVTREDPDLQMPPKENDRLTEAQTWFIRDWIDGGAPWPDDNRVATIRKRHAAGVVVETSGGLSEEWTNRRYKAEDLWAYQPLKPSPRDARDPASIDSLIDERLTELEVTSAPPADRRTLLRRATYDLIGLPPTPEEIQAFLDDPADDTGAFSSVVERLLSSPHYGEQWGRHWLDVVRYADSSGLANDYERGNSWRYRDYVIRSFNQDKPYDQFIREQVAGDELYETMAPEERDPELLVAAGFLRMGPWELTGMEVPKVARQRFLDDVTDGVGQVFLAHPLQCARCHDHKFDPIPTRDYYSLQAAFSTTQMAERGAPFLDDENTDGFDEARFLKQRQSRFEEILTSLKAKEVAGARRWAAERGLEYIPRGKGLKEGIAEDKLAPKKIGFEVDDFGMERISRKTLERLKWQLERYEPFAFSVYSGATPVMKAVKSPVRVPENRMNGEVEQTAILTGGDPFSPQQEVEPGVLSVLAMFNDELGEVSVPDSVSGRRSAVADWLTHPRNPLVARVMVNRIWQWHFGRGLAGSPNNFGATGKKPTHPELLDRLAVQFIEDDWSVKQMHRRIMMSAAYRRAGMLLDQAVHAPDVSYAAFQPRRLTAEEFRDSMLSVSGELNRAVGGIPNRPEINLESALQPRMVMGTFAAAWQPNPLPAERHRRSIYALQLRGLRDPFMEVFNAPPPELSCEARDTSTVTPQVFSLFNSQATYNRAVALAIRLREERRGEEHPALVRRAFQLAFGRAPTPAELTTCLAHWASMTRRHQGVEVPRVEVPTAVVRNAVEENTGEKFTFVEPLEFNREFTPDAQLADVDPETRGLAELCLVLFNSNEFAYIY